MKKRILSVILCLCMVLSLVPFGAMTALAETPASAGNWLDEGNYDTSWYDGVSASTYEISTPAQLAGVAYLVNNSKASFGGMTLLLANDIDLSAHLWTPIDNAGLPDAPIFAGTFDGNGHTISKMTVKGDYRENGLFGRCDGYIQNLTMDNAVVELPFGKKNSSISVGVVCGMLYTCARDRAPSHIKNCIVKNSIIRFANGANAGYIVGNTGGYPKPILDNNKADKTIFTEWIDEFDQTLAQEYLNETLGTTIYIYDELDYMAVLYLSSTGVEFSGYTIKLMADLDMTAFKWEPFKAFAGTFEGNSHSIVGLNSETNISGLVNEAKDGCKIQNLSIRVNLTEGTAGLINTVSKSASVKVENCQVYGNITGSDSVGGTVGGIIAWNDFYSSVVVKRCQNYATLKCLNGNACGGVIGGVYGYATIEECTNFGSITVTPSYYIMTNAAAGGIVGLIFSGENATAKISRCSVPEKDLNNNPIKIIATGNSEQAGAVGGFIGATKANHKEGPTVTITDSYCNAMLVAKNDAHAAGWTICSFNDYKPTINITGCYFGGKLLYEDENGKQSPDKLRVYVGIYFENKSNGLSDNSVVHYNHCIKYRKEDGTKIHDYSSLSLSNIKMTKEQTPTYFNMYVTTNEDTKYYQWLTSAIQSTKEYSLVEKLIEKSNNQNIWTNNKDFQSGLPYLTTSSPNAYELTAISPVRAGALKIASTTDFATAGKSEYYKFPSATNPTIDVSNGLTLQLQSAYAKTEATKQLKEYIVFRSEKNKQTPLVNGDIVKMYTLSDDKSKITGTYTYKVESSSLQSQTAEFAGATLINLSQFVNENGTAYTNSPDETRSMYFTVDFTGSGERNLGDFSVVYKLLNYSAVRGMYISCVRKEVPFNLVDQCNIELSADTAENGTISFYHGENTGYSGGAGVMTMISPKEGYQVTAAWITNDNAPDTKIPLDESYNFSAQGFSFVWTEAGKYTVHATFIQKVFSVVFTGDGCSNTNPENTVLYGDDYSFSINYDTGFMPVGENPVTVNGKAVSPDENKVYTVKNNTDAVRINVNTRIKADTQMTVEPNVTSLTYGDSVTLTATLKTGETALSGKTVKFYDGSSFLADGETDKNGTATYTVANPKAATHNFKATFSSDADYNTSTGTAAEVVVSKKALSVSVEPVVINKGQQIPTLIVKVGNDFVNGESAATLTGFKLPTASVDGTVDTTNTELNSFNIKYSGGNATGNYKFDLSNKSTAITINTVSVTSADYSLSADGTAWQKQDLTLIPENEYTQISTDGVNWQSTLTLSQEGEQSVTFFLKKADGTVTESETVSYKLDKTAPTDVQVQYNQNGWKNFLNTITFGIFFKENVVVSAKAIDNVSGVQSIEYCAADSEITDFSAISWQQSLTLTQNSKQLVYVKVTDNAGNYVISHEGIVVYTDSTLTETTAEFNFDKPEDVEIEVNLNDNTVAGVGYNNGTSSDELNVDTDYTINGNIITIKKSVFEQYLTGDSLEIKVSINPMGEVYSNTSAQHSKNDPLYPIFTVTKHIHTPKADDGDCSTPIECSACGFETTAAIEHNYKGEWFTDENSHWHVCQNDGCTVSEAKTEHSFNWIIDKEATETESGSKHEECSICKYKKATIEIPAIEKPQSPQIEDAAVEIPATGKPQSPQTGNNSNTILWISILFISGGAVTVLGISKKRRKVK